VNKKNTIFASLFALYGIIGLSYVFLGKLWADEGWYFGGSVFVANGEILYKDFFIHHNSLFFYIYSLPQYLLGQPSFILGRLTTYVIMLCIFVVTWKLAKKLGGRVASIIAGGLLVSNLFIAYYYTTISYRALEALVALLFFYTLASGVKNSIKYPLASFILCLLVGIRYPIDFSSVMLVLFMGWVIYRNWHSKRVIAYSLSVVILTLAALLAPYFIIAKEQFIFSTITFNFMATTYWNQFGVMGIPDIIDRIYYALLILTEVANIYFVTVVILTGLLSYLIFNLFNKRDTIKNIFYKNRTLVLMILFVLAYEGFCALAYTSSAGLRTLTFPTAVIIAGVGLSKLSNIKLIYWVLAVMFAITPFAQYGQGNETRISLTWRSSDVKYVLDVSNEIARLTDDGDIILTFTPPLVLQANRKLLPETVLELFSYFPTWDDETINKYNMLSENLLLDYISSRKLDAIVLTQDRFFSGAGMGIILNKYRQEILECLGKYYYLEETLSYDGIGRGNVYIYLPNNHR
jgi:hypothetical protein